VVTPSNPYIASDSEQVSPPLLKIGHNFSEEVKEGDIFSHLEPEEFLVKKVVTVVTEAETPTKSTLDAVTTSCHYRMSPPKTEFDAAAHAQTMIELLQEQNPGEWIDELMKDWSNKQKIQVREQLTPQQYGAVKAALHKFNSDKYSCAPTPSDVVGEVNSESTTTPNPSPSPLGKNNYPLLIEETQLPKIGQWVRLNDEKDKDLYQVVALSPSKGKVELESERGAMGHYSANQFTVLSKQEIVELGLLTTKLRPWELRE
jgi:hypothetical protein